MALIATEAYSVITVQTEKLMIAIRDTAPAGGGSDYLSGLVAGQLLGIYRTWAISGSALIGCGDEVFVSDDKRLLRLTKDRG